jgi:eukaryotic-like serine/threonine-protein kinase
LKLAPRGLADGQRQQRLIDDARAAAVLSHPNIATLFEVGHHEGQLYLAYEFVQGATVRHQIASGPMNTRHAIDLAIQVADAVAEGHSKGVLHKDLRPDTVLETAKGSAKVLDFGMSVWTKGGQTRGLAAASPGSVAMDALAVVAYMSPEQALGGRVDARTDVFSLGLIVYEMVTGRNPFADADPATTLVNIIQKLLPPPTTLNSNLPRMFDLTLARALTKDIERRTESAARFASDLRRCKRLLDGQSADAPGTAPHMAEQRADLHIEEEASSGLWWLLALIAAAIATAIYLWLR